MSSSTSLGLDGTVVAQTHLGSIDGIAGRLRYCGYDIHDLADNVSWEAVAHLLWHGELPDRGQLADLRGRLVSELSLSQREQELVQGLPICGHGMDALRTLVSGLGMIDPELSSPMTRDTLLNRGLRLTAKVPALLAAWVRRREGKEPVAPNETLGYAANILLLLHGRTPDPVAEAALNTYMVLLAEHGLNVSTFAARVAASTQNDLIGAITAAIATLKGSAHGGANEHAMRSFLAIGAPEQAEEYVEQLLAQKGRLMGVGHRIYKTEDPRVRHLRHFSAALAARPIDQQVVPGGGDAHRVAERVAEVVIAHPYFQGRKLFPNVEFYSAPLLYQLGFPLDCFTPAFACARMPGWVAHIREQLVDNRLIRPEASYVGPAERIVIQ